MSSGDILGLLEHLTVPNRGQWPRTHSLPKTCPWAVGYPCSGPQPTQGTLPTDQYPTSRYWSECPTSREPPGICSAQLLPRGLPNFCTLYPTPKPLYPHTPDPNSPPYTTHLTSHTLPPSAPRMWWSDQSSMSPADQVRADPESVPRLLQTLPRVGRPPFRKCQCQGPGWTAGLGGARPLPGREPPYPHTKNGRKRSGRNLGHVAAYSQEEGTAEARDLAQPGNQNTDTQSLQPPTYTHTPGWTSLFPWNLQTHHCAVPCATEIRGFPGPGTPQGHQRGPHLRSFWEASRAQTGVPCLPRLWNHTNPPSSTHCAHCDCVTPCFSFPTCQSWGDLGEIPFSIHPSKPKHGPE